MSVTEYKREFTWLSKYAPEMLVTERENAVSLKMALMTIFGPMSQDFAMMNFLKL